MNLTKNEKGIILTLIASFILIICTIQNKFGRLSNFYMYLITGSTMLILIYLLFIKRWK